MYQTRSPYILAVYLGESFPFSEESQAEEAWIIQVESAIRKTVFRKLRSGMGER